MGTGSFTSTGKIVPADRSPSRASVTEPVDVLPTGGPVGFASGVARLAGRHVGDLTGRVQRGERAADGFLGEPGLLAQAPLAAGHHTGPGAIRRRRGSASVQRL